MNGGTGAAAVSASLAAGRDEQHHTHSACCLSRLTRRQQSVSSTSQPVDGLVLAAIQSAPVVMPVSTLHRPSLHARATLCRLLSCAVFVALQLVTSCCADSISSLSAITVEADIDRFSSLALNDISLAYRLVEPNVAFSLNQGTAASVTLSAIAAKTVDFGTSSSGLSAAQATAMPGVALYPILVSAIVPIYRLDALASAGVQLVLSRAALAAIFEGQLTWWNDSRLVATNPSASLPAKRITVVYHNESLSMNNILTTALAKFDANFTHFCNVASLPKWPVHSYHASVGAVGPNAVAASVTAQDGSLGYAPLAVALQMNSAIAGMINLANSTVQANANSITYSAVELGTQTLARQTLAMDLTDASGSGTWPICAITYLLIDTVNSRSTCHARSATVDFWVWFYQSDIASGLLSNREYARVPDIVLSSLDTLNDLENGVLCRGTPAYAAAAITTRALSVPSSVSFLSDLLVPLYTNPAATPTTWTATTVSDQLAFDQLVNAEIDIAFFDPANVDAGLLAEAQSSGDFLLLPTFLYAMSWMYNPQITPTVNIASHTLRLDLHTISSILYSCISVRQCSRYTRKQQAARRPSRAVVVGLLTLLSHFAVVSCCWLSISDSTGTTRPYSRSTRGCTSRSVTQQWCPSSPSTAAEQAQPPRPSFQLSPLYSSRTWPLTATWSWIRASPTSSSSAPI